MPRPGRSGARWITAAALLLLAAGLFRHFELGQWLTLEALKAGRVQWLAVYQQHPVAMVTGFFALYVVCTALSLPGATVLTLAAGALFGWGVGLVLVSFASAIGATLAFLTARYLLRDAVQARFGRQMTPINEGLHRDGTLYLLTLRLVPVFPFFVINLLAGLTTLPVWRFYWVSQLGMLAATAVYVNAGTQLAGLQGLGDVLSPALLGSFVLLGLLPLAGKAATGALRQRRLYARWTRPRRFDRNVVVIGAGAGGLVTAYIAAAVKAKVTLVEAGTMGGDCLNTGCVPSKALIRAATAAHQIRQAAALGLQLAPATVDFPAVMARIRQVVAEIAPHDSVQRYTELGVDVVQGHARITSPWQVEVGTPAGVRTLSTRSIVIAAGARPFVPPIPGLAEVGCLTSDTVWGLSALPERLLVLGGGPIGCELAQAFARLGAQVTLVEQAPRLLLREDPDAAALVAAALRADGVRLLTGHTALRCEREGTTRRLIARDVEADIAIAFDELLCAVGRQARTAGYGLEELGIALTPQGTIAVDAQLRTSLPNIYAVGDVAGPLQFTHMAAHQAWHAAVNALFGRFRRFAVDESVIPRITFTDPEVARVGLSESEAVAQGIAYELTRYDLKDLDRAIADGTPGGFVKVLTVPGRDRILGATLVGAHAGELLAEFSLAMKHGLGLNKILGTVHPYPTLGEANKAVAGEWRRRHAPQRLLAWAERFHAWERR